MIASGLEFYKEQKISPVRQDIDDLTRHFNRRKALYRHLGILPSLVTGQRVLEVGPGSGFNSLYTAYLAPSRYLLVEGNPTGVEHIKRLFARFPELENRIEICLTLLEEFKLDEQFDLVFCEGVLEGVPNPKEILMKLAELLVPGGILVITCIDHVSGLAETLRRLFAQLLIEPSSTLENQVAQLLPIFEPHLRTLKAMSRRYDDWIIDNLINPATTISLIAFPDIVEFLSEQFDFYASSPHFVTDWRWYKNITGEKWDFNTVAIEQYWLNIHNLLDWRQVFPARSKDEGKRLYDLCATIHGKVQLFETERRMTIIKEIITHLESLIKMIIPFSANTAEAFREACDFLRNYPIHVQALAESRNFGPLFGRGQQYVSFTKKQNSYHNI